MYIYNIIYNIHKWDGDQKKKKMFQSQLKSQELRKAFERLDVDQSGATSGQFSQVNHGTKCAMFHSYVTGGYMEYP